GRDEPRQIDLMHPVDAEQKHVIDRRHRRWRTHVTWAATATINATITSTAAGEIGRTIAHAKVEVAVTVVAATCGENECDENAGLSHVPPLKGGQGARYLATYVRTL